MSTSTKALSEEIENLIYECWSQGKTQTETNALLNGAASPRQVGLRYSRFEAQTTTLPSTAAQSDPLASQLLDPALDSSTKESILLQIMESQVARLHFASLNPRQVAIDLKSERLLGERAESLLRAYRERPYEVVESA